MLAGAEVGDEAGEVVCRGRLWRKPTMRLATRNPDAAWLSLNTIVARLVQVHSSMPVLLRKRADCTPQNPWSDPRPQRVARPRNRIGTPLSALWESSSASATSRACAAGWRTGFCVAVIAPGMRARTKIWNESADARRADRALSPGREAT